MAKPVNNWSMVIDETSLFWDIADSDLKHYGPRAVWRALSRRDLGAEKAIYSGIIDLGYNTVELQDLLNAAGANRIVPLSISGITDEPKLKLIIPAPHAGGLTVLNSLPFPQYRLSVTVDLRAESAKSLIKSVEDGWATRTLLNGRFSGSAEGCRARGGFKILIDCASCINKIIETSGKREFAKADAWSMVRDTVRNQGANWIKYYGGAQESQELSLAEACLTSILVERCLVDQTLIQYDNGMSAVLSRLRDAATMGEAEARVLVRTTPEKLPVGVAFADFS